MSFSCWPKYCLKFFCGFGVILLSFSHSAFSGVITLKTGETISGVIIEKSAEQIRVRTKGEIIRIDRDDVAAIAGNKPDFGLAEDKEITLSGALELASQGKFLHAEEMFKKLSDKKHESDLPRKALEIINDFRNGNITYNYALALFQGAYYFYHEDFDQAIAVYNKALEINPQALEIYYNLANAYLITGDAQSAAYYLDKLAAVKPDDVEIIFSLAIAYQSLEKHQDAVFYFKRLITAAPHDPELHSLLASSYYALGKFQAGKEAFLSAKEMFRQQGQFDRAEKIQVLLDKLR